jgi:hypothetical protein
MENSLKSILKAARALAFGACRHRRMGWPIWLGGRSYRVCLDCGIQRLFDEGTLRGYGPYSYQIHGVLRHHDTGDSKRQLA